MKEIIHIQAGSLSNYTGTHYWNTQEDYFVYDENEDPLTDYNISFKEGRDEHNRPTLCPRLLIFDQKSNFGTLTKGTHQEEVATWKSIWHSSVARQEQERIPKSEYHSILDEDNQAEPVSTKIRFWSDFSRVFFDPKSIQPIPDMPEITEGDWNSSTESFSRYNDNAELMDGSLRLLVEECGNFQGVQMIQDTSIFGGFSNSLLSAFREEYPKATIVTFACLSSVASLFSNLKDSSQMRQVLNDVLSLRSVAEFCDLTVPLLPPSHWEHNCWFSEYDHKSLYQTSAILSTYVENATLPLRLNGSLDDLQTTVAHLNWNKSSPFAMLRGMVCPQGLLTKNLGNMGSLSFHTDGGPLFARRDVTRGLSRDDVEIYNAWGKTYELKHPLLMWRHLPSYPIPTSFAPVFPEARPKALKLVSSLSTSPSTGSHLYSYAQFVESAAKRRDITFLAMGLEDDEVKDLTSALWDIADGYGESSVDGGYQSEGIGDDGE